MTTAVRVRATAALVSLAMAPVAVLTLAPARAAAPMQAGPRHANARVSRTGLYRVGTSNLGKLGRNSVAVPHRQGFAPSPGEHFVATDPDNNSSFTAGGPRARRATLPSASGPARIVRTNVPGTRGFQGLTGPAQAAANDNGDLEPPDQGLCSDGSSIVDDVNNALQVYSTEGAILTGPVAATSFFHTSASAFFADPRCYYDAPTHRWFFTQFDVATFRGRHEISPSVQFIAVSNSANVLGSYTVYASSGDDSTTSGCPCLGDYDQIGADANGFYVSTNEYGDISGAFNGAIIYAYSKAALEHTGFGAPAPQAVVYRLLHDRFGQPYHVAPSQSPPGASYAPGTEYFVESNSDKNKDHRLVVYAMTNTGRLNSGGTPTLSHTQVKTEPYAFPPDAKQPPGQRPLGHVVGEPEGRLQADFNAIQEVTYTGGKLYAEADTSVVGHRDGVAWFVLAPAIRAGVVNATVAAQGYVTSPGVDLLYPDIAVNSSGHGYLVMSLTGRANGTKYFPSAAYQGFGPSGPRGPIHQAAAGASPEDGFTCYAAFVGRGYGGCRWGDYSMGIAAAGRIVMATEYIPAAARDYYTNWGTFVWSSPSP